MRGNKPTKAKVLVMKLKKMCEDEIEELTGHIESFDGEDDLTEGESEEYYRILGEKDVLTRILNEINKVYKYEKTEEFKLTDEQKLLCKWAKAKPKIEEIR